MGSPDAGPLALVVDDDCGILSVLTSALGNAGWRVETVSRGDQVIEAARRGRPDLVLLDVQMPGADGYTVLAHLRAEPTLRGLRVIFVSGEPADVHAPIARDLGADGFLEKPFRLEKLFQVLDESVPGTAR